MRNVFEQIERGLQRGKSFSHFIEGKEYYSQVAIQKLGDTYFVYTFSIEDALMAAPEDVDAEIVTFKSISEAAEYMRNKMDVTIAELGVCKGSRIFDPSWFYDS